MASQAASGPAPRIRSPTRGRCHGCIKKNVLSSSSHPPPPRSKISLTTAVAATGLPQRSLLRKSNLGGTKAKRSPPQKIDTEASPFVLLFYRGCCHVMRVKVPFRSDPSSASPRHPRRTRPALDLPSPPCTLVEETRRPSTTPRSKTKSKRTSIISYDFASHDKTTPFSIGPCPFFFFHIAKKNMRVVFCTALNT